MQDNNGKELLAHERRVGNNEVHFKKFIYYANFQPK